MADLSPICVQGPEVYLRSAFANSSTVPPEILEAAIECVLMSNFDKVYANFASVYASLYVLVVITQIVRWIVTKLTGVRLHPTNAANGIALIHILVISIKTGHWLIEGFIKGHHLLVCPYVFSYFVWGHAALIVRVELGLLLVIAMLRLGDACNWPIFSAAYVAVVRKLEAWMT